MLNKYIKCNFGGLGCGTSTIVDVRRLKVKETGNVRINVTLKRVRVTTTAVEKHSVSHISSECCIALFIQHAKRMRLIMSSVACPAALYFSTSSHKRHDFRGGWELLNMNYMFWFSLQLLSETLLILRRIQRDIIKILHKSSGKVPVIPIRS